MPKENLPGQRDGRSATELRKEKLKLRSGLTQEERKLKCDRIAEQVTGLQAWKNAQDILIYASFGAEVSTFELIGRALLEGKRVFCPKVEEDALTFYRIFSAEDLKPGFRGILEPDGGTEFLEASAHALLIAPGTVFDRKGHRIGYGGGYYDRYLGRFSEADRPYCVGLCYACQLTGRIVPAKHDIAMNLVIYA